jgi:hypothetical protein
MPLGHVILRNARHDSIEFPDSNLPQIVGVSVDVPARISGLRWSMSEEGGSFTAGADVVHGERVP